MTVMIITPVPVTSQDDDDEVLTVESNNSVKNNSKGERMCTIQVNRLED